MDLTTFREEFLNEEINVEAANSFRYPENVFNEICIDILKNDYGLVDEMDSFYYSNSNYSKKYKKMEIEGGYIDKTSNCVNLLNSDFNPGTITSITKTMILEKTKLMVAFVENALKGYFSEAEQSNPAVQFALDFVDNIDSIYKIHMFLISTNSLSGTIKTLELKDFKYGDKVFKIELDVLDINKIYNSRMAGFEKEEVIIKCSDFGNDGIPCIKADIETDQYSSYLAIVPGNFLADIYKKHGSRLLESNVRSFLKFNGAVNKGIKNTILYEKSKFFTYNNGISTTAKSVELDETDNKLKIVAFQDLQIINGGQTTATLASTSIKNKADLSGVYVQMKLTVLRDDDPELIRNISKYANSQNKVRNADLNSNHPFYVKMEDLSRKIYAPLGSGEIVQKMWFFERTRGQYDQPLMNMKSKKEMDSYKKVRPKNMKFTLTDMAKYINASEMHPNYVSWGGEVNSMHFHNFIEKQWEKNKEQFNERYYKDLIAKKIMYSYLERLISDQEWYQRKKDYRPQLVAYTFAKFVYEVEKINKFIDYKKIWDNQKVGIEYDDDLAAIAKLIFDFIYDTDNRSIANIGTYCKKDECWNEVKKIKYEISDELIKCLISKNDLEVQKNLDSLENEYKDELTDLSEMDVFNKGYQFWERIKTEVKASGIYDEDDIRCIDNAIRYCNLEVLEMDYNELETLSRVVSEYYRN